MESIKCAIGENEDRKIDLRSVPIGPSSIPMSGLAVLLNFLDSLIPRYSNSRHDDLDISGRKAVSVALRVHDSIARQT